MINYQVFQTCDQQTKTFKGLASNRLAETTFTFHFSILTLSNTFLSVNNKEMKSESGFSLAMTSQPLRWRLSSVSLVLRRAKRTNRLDIHRANEF